MILAGKITIAGSIVTFFLVISLLMVSGGCTRNPENNDIVLFSGPTMGTTYAIKVSGLGTDLDVKRVQAEIEALLGRIEQSMSTYIPESEISRFNRLQSTSPFPVSPILLEVVKESSRVSSLTAGALDITIAPLVDLWGFGKASRSDTIPDEAQIKSLKKRTGYKKISVTDDPESISKALPGVMIDLSAVAKGYAVDQVALLLEGKGLTGYLVEIGGEIRTGGHKTGQTPWVVGIERPVTGERVIQQVVSIGDGSMATSGDYRNYFEKNGKRFSHLIDPIAGRPIEHRLASVSVVHQSCMTADAFATAFMVMGDEKALRVALHQNLAAYFLVRSGTGFKVKTTPAFDALLETN